MPPDVSEHPGEVRLHSCPADWRDAVRLGLLGVYGVGMGAPFLLGAVLTRPFTRLAARTREYGCPLEWVAAGLIIVTGVLIISGRFSNVGLWMLETFPFFDRFG